MYHHYRDSVPKILLTVGFVVLAGGVLVAYTSPAHHYELSVYAATPAAFWGAVVVAVALGVAVALFARRGDLGLLGLGLAVSGFLAVVGLPIIRNYYFYGTADALTHLAWVRGIADGEKALPSLLYPAIHTVATYVGIATGYPLTRAILYVVALFALVFVAFVTLTAWALTGDRRTTVVAAIGALMLLPITNVSSKLIAHPTSQAVLFMPVPVYLLVRYLQSPRRGRRPTATGVALSAALLAALLVHPQQALNLLGMFVAISAVQFGVRRWGETDSPVAAFRPVYAQTGLLGVAFALWTPGHSRFSGPAMSSLTRLQRLVQGNLRVGAETAQRSSSLTQLGGGLPELFLKLFAVPTVFCLATGGLLLAILAGRLDDGDSNVPPFGRLMIAGFVPVTVTFGIYIVGQFGTQSFRHVAFLLGFATLFGAIGITCAWDRVSSRLPTSPTDAVVTAALLLALVVAAATFFPSPWIYLHSQHVTEAQMDGYESAFDHTGDSARFYGVRAGPDRYADAYNRGLVEDDSRFKPLNRSAMATDLSGEYGEGWYFPLTRYDRRRELGVYRGLRYSSESFAAARNQRGVNRVIDNGEFRLYYVTG